jgi:uncharacterized protein (DUF433 family)
MKNQPLPRKRKIVANPSRYKLPPKKDFIKPIIQTRRVITGFVIGERQTKIIRERQTIKERIRKEYPQVTEAQVDDAKIMYGDYHAWVELNQYSPMKAAKRELVMGGNLTRGATTSTLTASKR